MFGGVYQHHYTVTGALGQHHVPDAGFGRGSSGPGWLLCFQVTVVYILTTTFQSTLAAIVVELCSPANIVMLTSSSISYWSIEPVFVTDE